MSTLLAEPPASKSASHERPAEVANGPSEESLRKAREKEIVHAAFAKEELTWRQVDPLVVLWIGGMHVGAVIAPFYFDWVSVGVCVLLHWLTCSIGICLGYHRYLSHRSMKLKAPAEFVTVLAGVMAGEGRPLKWAATHRLHHQKSDHDGDPHSPTEGTWWSHLLWMFRKQRPEEEEVVLRRYVPELADRPVLRTFERHYAMWVWGTAAAVAGIGYLYNGWAGAGTFFLWGVCVRMVISYHSTWFVNSATHLWGYRNYDTRDHSRNLWWVAILSYGEGWHNNHHAHPSIAPAGHRWWEFDMTWWAIRLLRATGLAYDVKDKVPTSRRAADDENAGPIIEMAKTGETLVA